MQPTPIAANSSGPHAAPPIVHDVLGSPGQPLDAATGGLMEARFGHEFRHVRIHADGRAAEAAQAVNALAYTVGPDIVFGAGRYAPGTFGGQRLLAHELSHVLQQRSVRQVQRATPEDALPAPAVDAAGSESSSVTPPAVTPLKLRIADVWYDPAGKPLPQPLTPADKARLQGLVDRLKKDDPSFYAAIENEDVVVTRGALPKGNKDTKGNLGRHRLSVAQRPWTMSKLRWFVIEHGGIDLSQGAVDMKSDAWKKGVELFQQAYPDPDEQTALATEEETRTIASFSSSLILDLEQIDALEKAYQLEAERVRSTSDFSQSKPPQSALATLRHEAGHLLFERTIGYDKSGNPLPSTPLPEPLKSQVKQHSANESIATDVEMLSEYAAEGVEEMGAPFDMAKFTEENDPRFGISGYRDVDGSVQTPTGFGVRVARGLTLVAAKDAARKIQPLVPGAVFLLTVPKPAAEQRLFDVLMLTAPDKTAARDTFDQLKTDHPELEKYKSSIVAY